MTKLTNALLRRVAIAAQKHNALQIELGEAMRLRYGTTHSDLDCDYLIDALDCGRGCIPDLKNCDEHMLASGATMILDARNE